MITANEARILTEETCPVRVSEFMSEIENAIKKAAKEGRWYTHLYYPPYAENETHKDAMIALGICEHKLETLGFNCNCNYDLELLHIGWN